MSDEPWRRIIAELESRGGYAPKRAVLAAAGFGPKTSDPRALCDATMNDHRLYEETVKECVDGGRLVYLGLCSDDVDPSWLWANRERPDLPLKVHGSAAVGGHAPIKIGRTYRGS